MQQTVTRRLGGGGRGVSEERKGRKRCISLVLRLGLGDESKGPGGFRQPDKVGMCGHRGSNGKYRFEAG